MFKIINKDVRQAIRISGFSYPELSYPLHCSPNTICNHLKQKMSKEQKKQIINAILFLNKKRTAMLKKAKEALR